MHQKGLPNIDNNKAFGIKTFRYASNLANMYPLACFRLLIFTRPLKNQSNGER